MKISEAFEGENSSLKKAFDQSCTGELRETKFSDFIRNATDEEATEVFEKVIEKSIEDQNNIMGESIEKIEELFDIEFCCKSDFCHHDCSDETKRICINKTKQYAEYMVALAVQKERKRISNIIEETQSFYEKNKKKLDDDKTYNLTHADGVIGISDDYLSAINNQDL